MGRVTHAFVIFFFAVLSCTYCHAEDVPSVRITTDLKTTQDGSEAYMGEPTNWTAKGIFQATVENAPRDHDEWRINPPTYLWSYTPESTGSSLEPRTGAQTTFTLSRESAWSTDYTITVTTSYSETNVVTGKTRALKSISRDIFIRVGKVKYIYISFGDSANSDLDGYHCNESVEKYLTELGAQYDKNRQAWIYEKKNKVRFEVRFVGEDGFSKALSRQDAYVAFSGHSNYGIGLAWDKKCRQISDFFNIGSPTTGVVWGSPWIDGILEQQPELQILDKDIAVNPTNYVNALRYERFFNHAGIYEGQPIPYIGNRAPNNVFRKIYGSGNARFHYYALKDQQNPTIILRVRYPGCDDLPILRYKWLFIDSCYSGVYYGDSFKHGVFFYSVTKTQIESDSLKRFVQAVIEDKTPDQLGQTLNAMRKELQWTRQVKYEYKSY